MSEFAQSPDANNAIFEALEYDNVVAQDNQKAYEMQLQINALDQPDARKRAVANAMVQKLDAECHHMEKTVVMNGNALTKEIDLRHIDATKPGTFDIKLEGALSIYSRTFTDQKGVSQGYIVRHEGDGGSFDFYQLVKSRYYSLNIPNHGISVAQTGYVYIPVDGSTHVQLLETEAMNMPNHKMLDVYAPNTIDAVDEILEDTTHNKSHQLANTLRRLGTLSLEALDEHIFADSYHEVREHLGVYLSVLINDMRAYYIQGADMGYIAGTIPPYPVPTNKPVPGYVRRLVVDDVMQRIAVEAAVPFSDGVTRGVRYAPGSAFDLT